MQQRSSLLRIGAMCGDALLMVLELTAEAGNLSKLEPDDPGREPRSEAPRVEWIPLGRYLAKVRQATSPQVG
jgi:hypothetical protein